MILALLAAIALAKPHPAPAPPPEPPPPPPPPSFAVAVRWPEGAHLAVTNDVTTSIGTPIGPEKTHVTTSSVQAVARGGVLGVDPLQWTETVSREAIDVDLAGQATKWDSATGEDPPSSLEAAGALVGATYAVTVDPERHVVVTPDAIAPEAPLDPKQLAASVESGLRDLPAPGAALHVGDTWTSASTIAVPSVGDVAVTSTWTLAAVTDGKAHLDQQLALAKAPAPKAGADVSLATLTGSGTIVVDLETGLQERRGLDLELGLVDAEGKALPAAVSSVTVVAVQ